jgi:hypothetical protein
MLKNAYAQSLENGRLRIADVQAYICSHVKVYNNIDRSICCEVTPVCLCLNCEINGRGVGGGGGGSSYREDTVTYNSCCIY